MVRALWFSLFVLVVIPASGWAATAPPVPSVPMALSHLVLHPEQGGQRLRVTIPRTSGPDAAGRVISYSWFVGAPGRGGRCEPGALPALDHVQAGTVVDVSLPKPKRGWCRGDYYVVLDATVANACEPGTYSCRSDGTLDVSVAAKSFRVRGRAAAVCHEVGEAEVCHWPRTSSTAPAWDVTAQLDDIVGPEGATDTADHIFEAAFRTDPRLRHADWEADDDTFYGYPKTRAEAEYLARAVDRILRAGRYYLPYD